MAELSRKLGEVEHDGLITDINPKTEVRGKTIRKTATAITLKRGTILAKSSGTAGDGKLVILGTVPTEGETLTADCILCDDVTIDEAADVTVPVYTAGCFDANKVTVATDYSISETDYDTLRKYNIVFKSASPAN